MKYSLPPLSRLRTGIGLTAVAAALCLASGSRMTAADPKTDSPAGKAAAKKPAAKLTGAELYALNCNRCHPERYPTEFNSAQWKTVLTHMRVRANLPAKQAKEILKYLQEESGN